MSCLSALMILNTFVKVAYIITAFHTVSWIAGDLEGMFQFSRGGIACCHVF